MKKNLFIIMILIFLACFTAGCGMPRNIKNSPTNNVSPGMTKYNQSPGITGPHGTGYNPTNNLPGGSPGANPGGSPGVNPGNSPGANPGGSPGNNPGNNPGAGPGSGNNLGPGPVSKENEFIDDMLPVEYFSELKSRNVSSLNDDELKNIIKEAALSKNYKVYDLNDIKRSAVDSKAPAVDLELTLGRLKESKDMASTRFVFKGARVADTGTFQKIAEYSTPLLFKSSDAVNNMKIANNKLSGIVLRENEEFSFRYFLGKQTKKDGYKEAKIYVRQPDGQVEEEKAIAGGICQVSSTLHAACLDLNLKIKERHPHSKKVGYIEAGKDAAISGNYYDLKFENNLDHPIIINFKIDDTSKKEIVSIYKLDL